MISRLFLAASAPQFIHLCPNTHPTFSISVPSSSDTLIYPLCVYWLHGGICKILRGIFKVLGYRCIFFESSSKSWTKRLEWYQFKTSRKLCKFCPKLWTYIISVNFAFKINYRSNSSDTDHGCGFPYLSNFLQSCFLFPGNGFCYKQIHESEWQLSCP